MRACLRHFFSAITMVAATLHPDASANPITASVFKPGFDNTDFELDWEDIDSHDFHVQWGLFDVEGKKPGGLPFGPDSGIDISEIKNDFENAVQSIDVTRTTFQDKYLFSLSFSDLFVKNSWSIQWWQT